MAWGDGKPEGNGGNSCPQASHPPTPLALGRSTSLCTRTSSEGASSVEWPHSHLSAGKSSVQHPLTTSGTVMLIGASARQEGWGASRQLRLYVALRLPTLPGERYLKPVKISVPR